MMVRRSQGWGRLCWGLIVALAVILPAAAQKPADDLAPGSPHLVQPEQLAKELKSAGKPLVLYLGPRFLYRQAHIPGAEFIGMPSEAIEKLRARVAFLPKDSPVVIYCGCCPWEHCPNVRPGFAELKKAGLTKVRVLYLPASFSADWKNKGFPVASGDQPGQSTR
ncbi:MAG TPA: rhodanese-like domain-containing protein [Terriglobales bacterium]|nr:rhodanese-like domain-containing protein [Terriglobales bacterium]